MTNRIFACTLAASLLGTTAIPAYAQTTQAEGIEQIIVTAQKREESLQDTPLSIVALTSKDIEQKGISNVQDLQTLVPNLQMTAHPNGSSTALISIRGIGITDDQITQDPGTAVYIDGVYLARSQGLAMDVAELARIEVLRGPQGTLYGRNAKSGAINFITLEPKLGEFQFKEQVNFGSRDLMSSRTMLNVPLGDTFAARLGYYRMKQDGYVDNRGTGSSRWGDRNREAWRADVLWRPSDKFELRYAYDRSEIDDTPAFIVSAPLYPAMARRPKEGSTAVKDLNPNDITTQGHSLTAKLDLADWLTVKSITAYRKINNFQNENFLAGVLGPLPLFRNASTIKQHQWSEELQLIGQTPDKSLEYIVGLYYFSEKGRLDSGTVTIQAPTTESLNSSTIDNKAYAVFGQATWNTLDQRLHLTAGARWSRDEREATLARANRNLTTGAVVLDPAVGAGKKTYSNFSPTFTIAYDVTDDINVFARWARGYKTGGYNTRASSIARFNEGFGEETLTSIEGGIKSEFWDHRVRLNLTAFRGKYRDIQLNIQSDPTNPRLVDVLNAGRATIQGIEFEGLIRPMRGLTIGANYAYLDAKYNEVLDAAGNNLANRYRFLSPRNSYGFDLSYTTPDTGIGRFTLSGNYSWQNRKYASTSDPSLIIPNYGLLNGRIALSDIPGVKGLRVALWAKNLTDKEYYVSQFQLGSGIQGAIFGEPRTVGVEAIWEL
jgi:iron complex outermembrane receptor protein